MAPEYVGYIAMSLDGFIADTDGGVSWLDPFNAAMEDDGGYGEFIAGIDALVMGRATYEQVMGWGWPYESRPGYVLTRKTGLVGDHVSVAGDMATLHTAIRTAGHRRVWIMGGGETQRAALDAGMFDRLQIFIMPTLLGGGRSVFSPGLQHNLALTGTRKRGGGILQIDYEIGK